MKKRSLNIILFLTSSILFSCADDSSSGDSSTGANLTGDGNVTIPETETEVEIPGIEGGNNNGGTPPGIPTDLVRTIFNDDAYYMSAMRTNDYDKKWLEAKITFNQESKIYFPSDFAELFIFNIESDPSFEGQYLTSDSRGQLGDAWVSFSFKTSLTDRRIQFCGQPVFKNSVKYSKPVTNYPDYVFADTNHSHGIHIDQQEILKKWQSAFIAYHKDENGNIIECHTAEAISDYQLPVRNQNQIDSYFTIAPSTVILKITNGIKIKEYFDTFPGKKRAGLEVILKLQQQD